jgi:hypothetical protein
MAKKLSVFDFDDTLVSTNANVYITHSNGKKSTLNPAEYAMYKSKPGDNFDFHEFDGPLKEPKVIKRNFDLFVKVLKKSASGRRTSILTARAAHKPIQNFFKQFGITGLEIVALGSSDPQLKADWIEQQIKKGYDDIRFMDDSSQNIKAVKKMAKNYPNVEWLIKKVRIH